MEPRKSPELSPENKRRSQEFKIHLPTFLASTIIFALASAGGWYARDVYGAPPVGLSLPGGSWGAPNEVISLSEGAFFEVNAYHDKHHEIQEVRMNYKDIYGNWHHPCIAYPLDALTNTFTCEGPVESVEPGKTTEISFTVIGTDGVVNDAPEGIREVTVKP